ncbi:MAG: S49 family peptidase [Rhodospirillales bacterium]|nr:S49 family peptidase [Rhodospirillales bacterium]
MDLYSLLAQLPLGRFKEPPPVVAVIRLSGVIGALGPLRTGLTLSGLAGQIERAFKQPRLKAVALAINSPGGSPVQAALIGRRIRALAEEKEVPVIAFTEDVAASGGYWLACAADEIYADENSIVGSIGVISAGFGFPDLLQRFGVERRVHTAGDRKSMLDPFKEEDPKDVARLKALQKEIHESFKAQVRARRGERLEGSDKALFSGEFWTGRKAVELGLVDGLGDLRGVLRERYGEKLRLKRVDGARPWWRRRLPVGSALPAPQDWAAGLLAAAEERALWSRYGL